MHWLARLIIVVGGNALALWVANTYVPGFVLSGNWITLILIALVLAVLNFFLKPILTLILGPIIILTLGLGVLISMFTAITVSRTFLFAIAPKTQSKFKKFLFSNGFHF